MGLLVNGHWTDRGYDTSARDGRFLRQVGSEKPGSEPSQFNTPHGIAVDAAGNVYVADRANHRMQVFDNNLVLRAIYDNIGDSWSVCISPGPHQYLFDHTTAGVLALGSIARRASSTLARWNMDRCPLDRRGICGQYRR